MNFSLAKLKITAALLILLICLMEETRSQSNDRNYVVTRTMQDDLGSLTFDRIDYYDGLGRPVQTVLKKASPTQKDIVALQEYDAAGRKSKTWLPVPTGATGAYVPLSMVSSISSGFYSDNAAYSKPVYEPSPLGRIEEQYGPGSAWHATGKSVETGWLTNSASGNLACGLYAVASDNSLQRKGLYAAGQLYVTRTADEDERISYTFADKFGETVLQRAMNGTVAHDTYYIYDKFGNLRYVLPPAAADLLTATTTWNDDNATLKAYAYIYKYDERRRLKEKKLPGAGWAYLIYDNRDRLVLSQDAKLRALNVNKYHYTKYDVLNRPVEQGICTENKDYATLRNTVKASSSYAPYGCEANYYAYYDDYTWAPPYPYATVYTGQAQTANVKGLATGVKTKVLGTSTWLYTVNYYDKYGQLIQQFQSNPDGGHNRTSTAYNFTGQPTKQQVCHRRTSSSSIVYTDEEYFYDHMGRLTRTEYRYNQSATPVVLAQNTYDEIGRLVTKSQHNNQQYTDYKYNIRGWLTQVNDPTVGVSNNRLFAMKLYYETDMATSLSGGPQYNGNINGVLWRKTDGAKKGYNYSYDGLNRLAAADYGTYNGSWSNPVSYDMGVNLYDKNGNIQSLARKGSGTTNRELLTYNYNGNLLSSISGTYGGASGKSGSFSYDQNGNATSDGLRGLGTIAYFQEIDLPKQYYKDGNNKVDYTYDASGNKWKKTATISGSQSTTSYYGPFVYEGTSLSKVLSAEGYYSSGTYHYFLKDHLCNTRITYHYSGATAVKDQEEEYYPFGSLFLKDNLAENKYLYNGKELNKEFFENYDYGARFYDPELGRWHVIDNKAEKYYGTSPYTYALNNPIIFIDPDGNDVYLSIKNQAHLTAFQNFASTKQGQRFIAQFAGAGQTINGVTYKTAGKYSNINLSINSKNLQGKFGETSTYLTNSPKGKLRLRNMLTSRDLPEGKRKYEININLRNGDSAEQSTYTLGHESFVHAENNAAGLDQIESDVSDGTINSETKLVSRLRSEEMNANEEHKNLVTEGTDENTRMNTYVKDLNESNNTNIYDQYYENDKKNIKLLTLIVLSILCLTFCNNKHNGNIYDIGDQLNPAHFSIINTYQANGEVYKEVQHKTIPSSTFFIFGEKNRIFLYAESNVNSQRFKYYYDFFNNKFKENPTYIDSSMSSGNFICRKYLWNDSINHDFAILSSCKNINDTLTKLGVNWDVEAGNDSLITKLQNIDE